MMRREVAVVARAVVQRGDLARLADLAQGLERAMHGGERDMRMLAAHLVEHRFGARMVGGGEQRLIIARRCGVTASPPLRHRSANSASRSAA